MAMASNTVVLYLTHVYDDEIAAEYDRIKRECEHAYDVQLVYDASSRPARRARREPNAFGFRPKQILQELGPHMPDEKGRTLWPGSSDLIVMTYAFENSGYEFYWLVEYDVRFTGPWRRLFDAFAENPADLLTTTIRRYTEQPDWIWWSLLETPGVELTERDRLRAFLPVHRISNRAVRLLRNAYEQGWRGHYECTVPTIINKHGLVVEDIGGNGSFVSLGNVDRFYSNTPDNPYMTPGTFVWRPIREEPGDEPDTLWHPVKRKRRSFWPCRRRRRE